MLCMKIVFLELGYGSEKFNLYSSIVLSMRSTQPFTFLRFAYLGMLYPLQIVFTKTKDSIAYSR